MDQLIRNLKVFIEGLGVYDVEFPDSLTNQELSLIVELFVSAAPTMASTPAEGSQKMLAMLLIRMREELGDEQAASVLEQAILISKSSV